MRSRDKVNPGSCLGAIKGLSEVLSFDVRYDNPRQSVTVNLGIYGNGGVFD